MVIVAAPDSQPPIEKHARSSALVREETCRAWVNIKDPRIAKFLTDFSSSNGISICGLDPKANNCAF
jgi:hypothetical protein